MNDRPSREGASDAHVPALVRRYLEHVLPADARVPWQVRVTQVGEMRLKPGGRWLRFSAVEEFAVEEVAFSWRARFPIAPFVRLHVVDGYASGQGQLEARLFGLVPVMRARGQDVSEGEALRYLAELPWVPHAVLANVDLEWRELDAETVEVSARIGSGRAAVQLEFDPAGDIVSALANDRPRKEGKEIARRPWRGTFRDHAVLAGIRVPTYGEVSWELPDGPFTYWRGNVTSLELDVPAGRSPVAEEAQGRSRQGQTRPLTRRRARIRWKWRARGQLQRCAPSGS